MQECVFITVKLDINARHQLTMATTNECHDKFDQVRYKLDGKRLEISDLVSRGIVLSM